MRSLKRFLAAILTVAMLASVMMLPSFAAAQAEDMTNAEIVEHLGLLKGDSADGVTEEYLEKDSTRMQMAILYARWLGLEEEAYDYEEWADDENFVDYDDGTSESEYNMLAYYYFNEELGFIGTGDDMFEPQAIATNKQLAKVLLTAMGYPYGEEYDWSDILTFCASIGIDLGTTEFPITNQDIADALVDALVSFTADGETFAQFLMGLDIITEEALKETGINYLGEPEDDDLPATLEVTGSAADNFAEVELTFNQPLDKDTVTKDGIRVDGNKLAGGDKVYVVGDYGDGAVVRIFLKDGFVGAQNEKRTVSVTGFKTPNGLVMTAFSQDIIFRDSAAPAIAKVVAKGNSRLDIHFTEPVQETAALLLLSNYQVNERALSADQPEHNLSKDTNTARIVTIKNVRTTLAPGTYTLGIFGANDNVIDWAGNNLGYQTASFEIVEDNDGPIAQSVLDPVYPNKVKIEFDEEITEDAKIRWTENNRNYTSDSTSVDGNVATFKFSGSSSSKILPFRTTTITLLDAKDYSGNAAQAPLSFDVLAIADSVRPVIVDYGSEEEGEIWVKFDKTIDAGSLNDSSWTIKNADGDRVYDEARALDADDDDTVILTNAEFTPDTYTIVVKDVKDTAKPDANALLETTIDVVVPDTQAPTIVSATWGGTTLQPNKSEIHIFYSEKVDYNSAVTRGNYSLSTNDGRNYSGLPTTARVTLSSGDRLVKITGLDASKDPAYTHVRVSDIEDLSGNDGSDARALTVPGAPAEMVSAEATGKGKIEVTFTTTLTAYDIADFAMVVDAAGTKLSGISFNDISVDKEVITLKTNKELRANGTFGGKAFDIKWGNKIVNVTDGITPELVEHFYVSDGNYGFTSKNAIVLVFDEPVTVPTSLAAAFNGDRLIINKVSTLNNTAEVIAGVGFVRWGYSTSGPIDSVNSIDVDGYYALYIGFNQGGINAKDVIAQYTATTGNELQDAAGNKMTYFEKSLNIRNLDFSK